MFFNRPDKSSQASFPLKAIGQRQDIIPRHVIKWTYKQGVGEFPTKDDIILCNVGIHLLDGTEIMAFNSSVTKFIYGKDLLIEGLQIALSHCQKGQNFKVKISSEYAYEDRQEIKEIPPHSSLIFEISILNIIKPKLQSLNLIQAAQQIRHLIERSDDQLRKQNPQKAVQILCHAYQVSHVLKQVRSPLGQKILAKMINIRLSQKKLQEALKIIEQLGPYKQLFFTLTKSKIKIYEQMGQLIKIIKQIKQKYIKYHHLQHAKQQLTLYFKKINRLEDLALLEEEITKNSYSFKDSEQHRSLYPLGMKSHFF